MLEPTEVSGLCKDTETHAVINTDNGALSAYKSRKIQLRKMNSLESRVQDLEKEVKNLKNTIVTLLSKK